MLAQLKKHLTLHELWEDAKFFFLLNLGLVATAVGIAVFTTPNHFAFGGTSGLSIVPVSYTHQMCIRDRYYSLDDDHVRSMIALGMEHTEE